MFLSTKKNYPNAGPNTSTVWEVKPQVLKFLFISTLHFPSLCFNTNFKDDFEAKSRGNYNNLFSTRKLPDTPQEYWMQTKLHFSVWTLAEL